MASKFNLLERHIDLDGTRLLRIALALSIHLNDIFSDARLDNHVEQVFHALSCDAKFKLALLRWYFGSYTGMLDFFSQAKQRRAVYTCLCEWYSIQTATCISYEVIRQDYKNLLCSLQCHMKTKWNVIRMYRRPYPASGVISQLHLIKARRWIRRRRLPMSRNSRLYLKN